jgi:hypothetical protein
VLRFRRDQRLVFRVYSLRFTVWGLVFGVCVKPTSLGILCVEAQRKHTLIEL